MRRAAAVSSPFHYWLALSGVVLAVAAVRLTAFSPAIFAEVAARPGFNRAPAAGAARIDTDTARLTLAKTFVAEDGRRYPYLGNQDSYYWLRAAEQVLATGRPCDEIRAGQCRDTLSQAPVGTQVTYGHSLHVQAIALAHRLARFFNPRLPLSASAMGLALAVALLGCLPACALGARLGGVFGGMTAGLVIGLNPVYLARSAFGDNDVWNVVLPLFMAWGLVRALEARHVLSMLGWVAVAVGSLGLHAAIWSGWPFAAIVLMAGLVGAAGCAVLQWAFGLPGWRSEGRQLLGRIVRVTPAFGVIAASTIAGITVLNEFVTIPGDLHQYLRGPGPRGIAPVAEPAFWPNGFIGIAELEPASRQMIAGLLGIPWLSSAMAGIYVMCLPSRRLGRWDLAAVVWMAVCGFVLTDRASANHLVTIGALVIPLVLALHQRLREPAEPAGPALGLALVAAAWFIAALYVTRGGSRFLLLMVVPYGLICAALVGCLHAELRARRSTRAFAAAGALLCATAIALPIYHAGRTALANDLMDVDDAWWATFEELRETPPDTIINTAWDYGHLAKYVAQRRVSNDGATIGTHVKQWFARVLVTSDERESIGVLRMLNCGSDALPSAEGNRGAFGLLRAAGLTDAEIHPLLLEVATVDRGAADALFAARGLEATTRARLLDATHCTPPPSYLVISDDILRKAPLWRYGLWSYAKAVIVGHLQAGDVEGARRTAYQLYRDRTADADAFLAATAAALPTSDPDALAAPRMLPYSPGWQDCAAQDDGTRECRINTFDFAPHWGAVVFSYRPEQEYAGTLETPTDDHRGKRRGRVASVFVATPDRLVEHRNPDAEFADVAVLFDPISQRIFFGPRFMMRSLLVQTLLLDGRYLRHFRKVDARYSIFAGAISTWSVRY